MSNQRNPNLVRIPLSITLEDAARLRTYLRGRKVEASSIGGKKIVKKMRQMRPSDFYCALGHERLASVVPAHEDVEWMAERRKSNLERRIAADKDVQEGKYRSVPFGERQKPGRKAGVYYPAYEAAIARRKAVGYKRKKSVPKTKPTETKGIDNVHTTKRRGRG